MTPTFFAAHSDFRRWLADNHERETELLVGFYKVGSGKLSMNWSQSVDEALCFGWIDGVRRKVDEESYAIRFTPRKSKSVWSAVNIAKVAELTEKGLMQPAGIAAFAKREESKSKIYAYENEDLELSAEFENTFRKHEAARIFFEKQANWYRKQMIYWVMSAKQAKTRQARFEKLLNASGDEKRL